VTTINSTLSPRIDSPFSAGACRDEPRVHPDAIPALGFTVSERVFTVCELEPYGRFYGF
jgi:hypothetical protein